MDPNPYQPPQSQHEPPRPLESPIASEDSDISLAPLIGALVGLFAGPVGCLVLFGAFQAALGSGVVPEASGAVAFGGLLGGPLFGAWALGRLTRPRP